MARLTIDSLSNLESLQLRTRTLVESVLTGSHRGNQKGFSIDFSEHRDYSPGDDVRFIDWKLLGKRDRFYIRQFEDENQLQAWILLDTSGSMLYRSEETPLSKIEYTATLAAAIGWIACFQRDQAALLTCDNIDFTQTGPVFGQQGAKKLIKRLEEQVSEVEAMTQNSSQAEDQFAGLLRGVQTVPKNSVVFILSDAFGEPQELKKVLTILQHKKCDTRLLHTIDSAELNFPFSGNMLFKGLEAGEYQTQSQTIRAAYREEFQQFLKETGQLARQTSCQYYFVNTQDSPELVLRQLLYTQKN